VPDSAPGPFLRLTAIAGAAAAALVVASGSLGLSGAHDALALIAGAPLTAVLVAAITAHRRLLPAASTALGLLVAEIAIGGIVALAGKPPWALALHLGVACLALAASCVSAAETFRSGPVVPGGSWRDYVTLTKPRIMSLLLLTGAAGAFVGAQGVPSASVFFPAMLGLALACGGASALNHVLDRDIDRLMGKRTRNRPVAAGRVAAPRALEFGLSLSACSFVLLAGTVNLLTAALALVGNLFYVIVYTGYLKRSTPQNIVIGGAAGAVPPLVGYAATSGDLALPALFLFLIVFVWTPPHFWALALLIKRDYAAAGVPMLPVVRGDAETARQIVRYSFLLVGVTLLPVLFWHALGPVYLGSATVLGGIFCWYALRLRRNVTPARASALFHYSLLYLALIFVAAAAGAVVG
jgi:protoheme IX farnesyltransferase